MTEQIPPYPQPYARVVADSTYDHPQATRLTTMEVRFHRFVLAEFNTHRLLVKNSASSRAIPFSKMVERVRKTVAVPEAFPREQKGMQGGDLLEGEDLEAAIEIWREAAHSAVFNAESLAFDVHKSVVNRLLEPFLMHTVVVTGTNWENFFEQRCSPLAQPEIRVAAEAMADAMGASKPKVLEPGQWHLPYISEDLEAVNRLADMVGASTEDFPLLAARASSARCARVSYETQSGVRDVEEDLRLYERLTTARPPHWSPLEHPATPWPENRQEGTLTLSRDFSDPPKVIDLSQFARVGSLVGWGSLRTELEAEHGSTYR